MQVIAVSPESEYRNEANLIVRLLDAGLSRYHLRKPEWTVTQCAGLLDQLPKDFHSQLSIHQCYELTESYAVSIHLKDDHLVHSRARSRSLHDLPSIREVAGELEYAILSPVFPSISKKGYAPTWSDAELGKALEEPRGLKLFALGGITATNAGIAIGLGFDGVVLYGSLWQAVDPVEAFRVFRKEAA